MELRELLCFARVAETLNFNRAAGQLNMSQPVVTKTIAQLEHKLGVRLFERTTRRVSLTAAGVVLRRETEGLLAEFDRVQREVRHAIGTQSGRFAIGATPLAMQTIAPHAIRRFREQQLGPLDVSIGEYSTDAQIKSLLAAEIDVGFVLAPVEAECLNVQVIHEETMRLAVSCNHSRLCGMGDGPIPLSAFAAETFIIPRRSTNPGVHDEIVRACEVSGFRPKVQDCHESQSCLSMVEAGLGVCFVMQGTDYVKRSDMRILDLDAPAPVLSIALAWRRDDPSPFVKQFIELAYRTSSPPTEVHSAIPPGMTATS